MSLESPVTILYNTEGYEISLSQSMPIATTQPGLMVMGSSSIGASFIRMSNDGSIFVTGSFNMTPPASQDVVVTNPWSYVTGTNSGLIINQGLSASNFNDAWKVVLTDASGSYMGLNSGSALWVTGNISTIISGPIETKEVCALNTTVTGVNATTTVYTIFAANNNRNGATFYKQGAGTAYLKLGSGASNTSYTVQLKSDSYWELPYAYCGDITIIFSAASAGSVVATEVYY